MRLLYVVDGRSPIARSWIEYFIGAGHEVHLVSSRPAPPLEGMASLSVVPVAFSGFGANGAASAGRPAEGATAALGDSQGVASLDRGRPSKPQSSWWRSAASIPLRTALRHWFGPLTVPGAGRRLRPIIDRLQPELVHAMRLPFEGAMAAAAGGRAPLVLSTWGNDFTLHAPASPLMRRMTRRSLRQVDGLHSDCQRDVRLAAEWGFDRQRPTVVLPGNGGVRREVFHTGAARERTPEGLRPDVSPVGPPGEPQRPELAAMLQMLSEGTPLVVNPRGFRGYVRNDSFFRSVPLVRRQHPKVQFACVAMAGERRAEGWLYRLGIRDEVHLLPQLSTGDMAVLMRRAQVMVSPSEHDGTPNTLLEAMACGAYPVAGRLESVAEWIEDRVNGALVDPGSPEQLAAAISAALADPELRAKAAEHNQRLIDERAEYRACLAQAERFYAQVSGG